MRLIVVRHGQTNWNQERRFQGHTNIELNELGRQQAEAIALALKNDKIEAIYASPLRRALETAQAIARFHSPEVEADGGLKELDVGDLNGLLLTEARDRYGDFLEQWWKGATLARMPGGESLQELQQRAWASIQRIINKHPQGTVVVVAHYFAILSIFCRALGLPLSDFRRLRVDIAAISALDFTERGPALVLLNDTCHLGNQAS